MEAADVDCAGARPRSRAAARTRHGVASLESCPQRALPPRRFLERYSLPRVASVAVGAGTNVDAPLGGPLGGPLLLFRHYRSTKVRARSLSRPRGRAWEPAGPALVVPTSYQGWFSQITAKGQPSAMCFSTVQQLVNAGVTTFLTNSELPAYRPTSGSGNTSIVDFNKSLQYTKVLIKPGNTVRLLAIFEDLNYMNSQNNRRFFLFMGKKANKYAQCLNGKSQVVFVPLTARGEFYAITAPAPVHQCVSQMASLLPLLSQPLAVHLTVGSLPSPLPTGFTGSLLLEGYEEEDVILACALPYNFDNMPEGVTAAQLQLKFLEIDADAQFLLSRPIAHLEAEIRLFKTPFLQSVLTYCQDKGESWSCQFKVTHHVCPVIDPFAPPLQMSHKEANKEKRNKSLGKLRFASKKSSSFTYTPSDHRHEIVPAYSSLPNETVWHPPDRPQHRNSKCVSKIQHTALPGLPSRNSHESPNTDHISSKSINIQCNSLSESFQHNEVSSINPMTDDMPYSHAVDAIQGLSLSTDENVYAEICDVPKFSRTCTKNLEYFYNMKIRSVERTKDDCYYVQLDDGRYLTTLSSREESIVNYDTVS